MLVKNVEHIKRKAVIAGNLKYYRKLGGLTQQQLADKCEYISKAMLGSYEEERAAPDPSQLVWLAMALRIEVGDLLSEDPPSTKMDVVKPAFKDRLYVSYLKLPEQKKKIVDFILNS
jgi:transcriptional regulator with XRE-family HTH domain